jgi:hypothetical protein
VKSEQRSAGRRKPEPKVVDLSEALQASLNRRAVRQLIRFASLRVTQEIWRFDSHAARNRPDHCAPRKCREVSASRAAQ